MPFHVFHIFHAMLSTLPSFLKKKKEKNGGFEKGISRNSPTPK